MYYLLTKFEINLKDLQRSQIRKIHKCARLKHSPISCPINHNNILLYNITILLKISG